MNQYLNEGNAINHTHHFIKSPRYPNITRKRLSHSNGAANSRLEKLTN